METSLQIGELATIQSRLQDSFSQQQQKLEHQASRAYHAEVQIHQLDEQVRQLAVLEMSKEQELQKEAASVENLRVQLDAITRANLSMKESEERAMAARDAARTEFESQVREQTRSVYEFRVEMMHLRPESLLDEVIELLAQQEAALERIFGDMEPGSAACHDHDQESFDNFEAFVSVATAFGQLIASPK